MYLGKQGIVVKVLCDYLSNKGEFCHIMDILGLQLF